MGEASINSESSGACGDKTSEAFADLKAQVEQLKLKAQLEQVIDALFTSAKGGDAKSFDLLVQLAKNASFKVSEAALVKSDIARQIARQTPYWPILLSTSDKLNRDNASFVTDLGLGAECSSPISVEKTFKGNTGVRKVALTLVYVTIQLRHAEGSRQKIHEFRDFLRSMQGDPGPGVIEERRLVTSLMEAAAVEGKARGRAAMSGLAELAAVLGANPGNMNRVDHTHMRQAHALPPISDATREQWFQFGMEIILLATDNNPETSPFLRDLGDYRKDKYPKLIVAMEHGGEVIGSEILKIKQQGRAKKTEASNFWDGVTTKIRNVFYKVVV